MSNILRTAIQTVGVFFVGFNHAIDLELMKRTFITNIRPFLEINSKIQNLTKNDSIDELESFLRHFTTRVPSLCHLSYLVRLSALKLEPLKLRCLKLGLIQYCKIPHHLTCIDLSPYLNYPPSSSRNPAPFFQKASNLHHFSSSNQNIGIRCFSRLNSCSNCHHSNVN